MVFVAPETLWYLTIQFEAISDSTGCTASAAETDRSGLLHCCGSIEREPLDSYIVGGEHEARRAVEFFSQNTTLSWHLMRARITRRPTHFVQKCIHHSRTMWSTSSFLVCITHSSKYDMSRILPKDALTRTLFLYIYFYHRHARFLPPLINY